jgi:phosphoribosyl-AMP cyclohydrolase
MAARDHHDVEEGTRLVVDWHKLRNVVERGCEAIVPVAVQDSETRDVLIVAYANELALAEARRATSKERPRLRGAARPRPPATPF